MLYYETEHKKYGVYCMEYILDCWECTELVGEYSSHRLAERVASILNEMYDDLYIVEELQSYQPRIAGLSFTLQIVRSMN